MWWLRLQRAGSEPNSCLLWLWPALSLSLSVTTLNASHSSRNCELPVSDSPSSQLFVTVRPGKMPPNPTGNDS